MVNIFFSGIYWTFYHFISLGVLFVNWYGIFGVLYIPWILTFCQMKCWDFLPFCLLYIDFILYYLLKVLTISQSFIRYFKSNIISSSNGDNVTFSILSSIQVVYFFNIFALPQISLNIVNKSSESVLSCLIFDFRGNEFSFFPFNVELAIGLFSFVFKINLKHYSFIFIFLQTFFLS